MFGLGVSTRSRYKGKICETCAYWQPSEESVETVDKGFLGDIGECHASAPKSHIEIEYTTGEERDRYNAELNNIEQKYREAVENWNAEKEESIRKMQTRLKNIEESIKTCKESSLAHWQQKLDEQKEKIKEKEWEDWRPEFFRDPPEPKLRIIKGAKGVWPITSSNDWCGEWKEEE